MEVQNNVYLNFSIHNQEHLSVPIESYSNLNSIILEMRNQIFRFYEVVKDEMLAKEAMQVAEQKINFLKTKVSINGN